MPTARRIATPRNSASTAQSRPLSISPVSNAGSTTWSVDQPSTQASATVSAPKSTLPSVESAKIHGSRRIATSEDARSPPGRRPVVAPPAVRHLGRHPLRSSRTCGPSGYSTPQPLTIGIPAPRPSASAAAHYARRMTVPSGPPRTRGALRPRPRAGRGRPDALRGLDRQGPGRPPAGPRAQPDRRVGHRGARARPGSPSGRWRRLARRDFAVLVETAARARGSHAGGRAAGGQASTPWSTSCTTRTCAGPSPAGSRASSTPADQVAALVGDQGVRRRGLVRRRRGAARPRAVRHRRDRDAAQGRRPGRRDRSAVASSCSSCSAGTQPGDLAFDGPDEPCGARPPRRVADCVVRAWGSSGPSRGPRRQRTG